MIRDNTALVGYKTLFFCCFELSCSINLGSPPGRPGKVRAMCCSIVMFRSFRYPSQLPWLYVPNPFNNMFYVCDWLAGLKTATDKSCRSSSLAGLNIVEQAKQNQQTKAMRQLHCHVSTLSRSFSTNMALGSKPFQNPRPALTGSNRNNMCSVCNRSAGLKTAADKSCVTSFLASLTIVERAKQNQQRIWPGKATAMRQPFMKCRRTSPRRFEMKKRCFVKPVLAPAMGLASPS